MLSVCCLTGFAVADEGDKATIKALEEKLNALLNEVSSLRQEVDQLRAQQMEGQAQQDMVLQELDEIKAQGVAADDEMAWFRRFTLGGYGEIHYNNIEGTVGTEGRDFVDIHRFVLFAGYKFNDWISLESETELEHAYILDDDKVGTEGEGYLLIEQLYVNFLIDERFNVRVGRLLMPLGIINQHHEPTSFYGVERPTVDNLIIPSTWHAEGISAYGNILSNLRYQLYVTNGLDGTKFTAMDGIRPGRMREQPSFNDVAFSGRLDWFPLANIETDLQQDLRLGASFFTGGVDNVNKGRDRGAPGDVTIYSADAQYSIWKLDFRGVVAYTELDDADELNVFLGRDPNGGNNVADEMFGWYVETALRFWPDSWKTGAWENTEAAIFARYEEYDTQYSMPSGYARNARGDRQDTTIGLSFYPTDNLVIKGDYQWKDDASDTERANQWNLGIGWQF